MTHSGLWPLEVAGQALLAGLDLARLGPVVAVDDADLVAGDRGAEAALFHLYNLTAAAGGRLLLTARTAPGLWGVGLPDLLSRLQSMAIAALELPDDALLCAVLVKLFADRQIAVSPSLVSFLTARIDRSIAAAREVVALLDHEALAKARPISRALAAEVLELGL